MARRTVGAIAKNSEDLGCRAPSLSVNRTPEQVAEWVLARVDVLISPESAALYGRSERAPGLHQLAVRGKAHQFPSSLKDDSALVVRLASGPDSMSEGQEEAVDREFKALGSTAAFCARSGSGLELVVLLKSEKKASEEELLAASAAMTPAAVAHEGARLLANPRLNHLEKILDSLAIGIIASDAHGNLLLANRSAKNVLDVSWEQLEGRHVSALPSPLADIATKCFETRCDVRDLQVTPEKDNSNRHLSVSVHMLRSSSGEIQGGVVTLNDATAVEELRRRAHNQERLAWLGTLSAGIAHELRNPLVSIRTLAQLLPEKYDDPEFRNEFSALALSEVDRINSIVDRLLNFARPSELSVEVVDVNRLLEDTLALLKPQIAEKNARLRPVYSASSAKLLGDPGQLKEVFLNLILNSLQAIPENGRVTVKTLNTPGARELLVEISDNGVGIPGTHTDKVFEPFFSTKTHGSGLGLTISQMIVRQHDGRVKVESKEGKGTTFSVLLPLASGQPEQKAP